MNPKIVVTRKKKIIISFWCLLLYNTTFCSEEWLKRMDKEIVAIKEIMEMTYGKENAVKWMVYWRTFFIAVAELFGYNNGEEWMVSHFLFKKKWWFLYYLPFLNKEYNKQSHSTLITPPLLESMILWFPTKKVVKSVSKWQCYWETFGDQVSSTGFFWISLFCWIQLTIDLQNASEKLTI